LWYYDVGKTLPIIQTEPDNKTIEGGLRLGLYY